MLYSQYSNPLELISLYINQGRFGHFVSSFIDADKKRKEVEMKKDEDNKLWLAYLASRSEKPYGEWLNSVVKSSNQNRRNGNNRSGDESLDDEEIASIINGLFPDDISDSPKRGENPNGTI